MLTKEDSIEAKVLSGFAVWLIFVVEQLSKEDTDIGRLFKAMGDKTELRHYNKALKKKR